MNFLLNESISDLGTRFSLKNTPLNIFPEPAEVFASVDMDEIAAFF